MGAILRRSFCLITKSVAGWVTLFALTDGSASATAGYLELGHPVVRAFTPRDYQADPLCQAVAQGADGILYFANNINFLTYDGVAWRTHRLLDGSVAIRQFARAADGTLCVGGAGLLGYLHERDDGAVDYVSLLAARSAAEQRNVDVYQTLAHGDTVYFVTEQQIYRWRAHRLDTIACPTPANSRGPRVHAVGAEAYVTAPDAPLRRLVADRLELVADDPLFHHATIIAVEAASDPAAGGALRLLTAEQGWFEWRAGHATPWTTPMNASLAGKRVRQFLRLPDGSAAVAFATASGNGGLLFGPDGQLQSRLDESIGLPHRALRDFCSDSEGGLWIGLESGLARVEPVSLFTAFDALNGLGHGFVSDFARHDGTGFASTLEGVYQLIPGDGLTTAARFEKRFNLPVYSLASHPAALFAFGYSDLFTLGADGFAPLCSVAETMGVVRRSRTDPDRVWFTTSQGLDSVYLTAAGWRHEGLVPGTMSNDATLGLAADGSLWMISARAGLLRLRFSDSAPGRRGTPQVDEFPAGTAGLPATFRGSHITHSAGEPVFSFDTTPTVFRFDSARQQFVGLPGTRALPGENLEVGWASSDSLDPANTVQWLANSSAPLPIRALFAVPRDGSVRTLPHAIVDAASRIWRMRPEETPDSAALWLCSANGLLRVDPRAVPPAPAPYAVRLRCAVVRASDVLPADHRALDFDFVAPRFRSGTAMMYQTRLAGYETAWSPWSADHRRTFTHLPGGRYAFEVRARDSDGVPGTPAALAFSVLRPWWLAWWFVGLTGLSGVSAIAGATRWLATRALQRRVALLEAQSAIERERLRLARDLHDEVGSGLGRVILFAGEADRVRDDPAQLDAALHRVRSTAQELIQHAREIVWAVSPQHDTLASLIERLGDYTTDTLRAAGIVCRLDAPAADAIPAVAVGSELRHSLFLAVKEAVHNCIKYSGAHTADLTLRLDAGSLEIVLQDHGRGFFAGERQGSGHGLRNLVLRAEALGGSGSVKSEPGHGTTVRLHVPLATPSLPPA